MLIQCQNLKKMLAANSYWVTEVNDAGNELDYIHLYAAIDKHHDPMKPRAVIYPLEWSTDYRFDACTETFNGVLTLELPRDEPADNATALETQVEEVWQQAANICNELSKASYDNTGAPDIVAQLLIRCGEPRLEDIAENKVIDPESTTETQKYIWWFPCQVIQQGA